MMRIVYLASLLAFSASLSLDIGQGRVSRSVGSQYVVGKDSIVLVCHTLYTTINQPLQALLGTSGQLKHRLRQNVRSKTAAGGYHHSQGENAASLQVRSE